MVSLRIRQRSSSERERARASLPLILVAPTFIAPRQANGGARGRGHTFLAPRAAEPLTGRRLHRDARNAQSGDLGDPRTHGVAQRSDLRALADQRYLEVRNAPAARGDAIDGVFEEAARCSTPPFGITRRKMRADIAVRQRTENGVNQRMETDVAVGMGKKAAAVRHADAADHQVIAIAEGVPVIAGAGADIAEHGAKAGFFADKIFRGCQFPV